MKQHGMVMYETHTYYISHFFHHRIIFIYTYNHGKLKTKKLTP